MPEALKMSRDCLVPQGVVGSYLRAAPRLFVCPVCIRIAPERISRRQSQCSCLLLPFRQRTFFVISTERSEWRNLDRLLIMNRFLDSALRAPLEMTEWTALRDKAFRLPQGGHIHPRRVQGDGPVGSKLSRSDDADDDGRGRSEAQPNGAPPVAA